MTLDDHDPSAALAAFAATAPLPSAEILTVAWDLMVDTLGCVMAGSSADGIAAVKAQYLGWGGVPAATAIPFGERSSPPNAAFINSVSAHARDYDDTHDAAVNHGCVTIVPACLALAEARGRGAGVLPNGVDGVPVGGAEFAAATAIALEVGTRLGLAFIPYLHTGWLPTTMWGPFAATVACGRLLRLDARQMHHALGLAYAQVHGNRQALLDGTLAKRVQPAFSAVAGLQAACLAARGITGPSRIIDGEFGLPAMYTAAQIDRDRLTAKLGADWAFLDTSVKPYPCCRCTHAVIDAADQLRRQHPVEPQAIASGQILLPPNAMGQVGKPFVARANPTVDAQFSAAYTAAYTLLYGPPGLDSFDADRIRRDRAVADLAARLSAAPFEAGNSGLVPIELRLRMNDGNSYHTRVAAIKGSRAYPLTAAEKLAKFIDCSAHAATPLTAAAAAQLHRELTAAAGGPDVCSLVDACCRAPATSGSAAGNA